eukprot:CAMPEP_0181307742 /NCGR_PEP_ID=MMETSP1101-20121128/11061_1 /TAXON_ID=46948 /ORGANISM="Rhodomonas abbreviata, Strain Caron Lab Isolate" /LENGTH=36 /DNA_ID= /DNA_START= /DNA_END= /DNA_ORIENTATION=
MTAIEDLCPARLKLARGSTVHKAITGDLSMSDYQVD